MTPQPGNERRFDNYHLFFQRTGNRPPLWEEGEKNPSVYAIRQPWLPLQKDARILDLGCGLGHQLFELWCAGYRNLEGIDLSEGQAATAAKSAGKRVRIRQAEGAEYLAGRQNMYDLIVMMDMIEHIPETEALPLLRRVHEALVPGGRVVVRTGNMATLTASFIRYIDLTHTTGFTEISLAELLTQAGFNDHNFVPDWSLRFNGWRPWVPWRRLGLRALANNLLHRLVYWVRGHTPMPQHFAMNLTVYSRKPLAPG
jgi:2-polyprenyl-3-methyl-5-hydroxy-6-metoxy-1,4-benzoquinol methylase